MIYLDNAATTMPYNEVTEEMAKADREFFANPSSMHTAGYNAEKKVNDAEDLILKAIGGTGGKLIFTSGGTESNNLAFFGTVFSTLKRKPHIITTKIEHPSVLEPAKALEALGAEVTYISPDEKGFINPDDVLNSVKDNTVFVSVMAVNNETGAIQPIAEIAKKVKSKNSRILVHTDCVQAFGNIKICASLWGVDLISLSGHKIHGPKGVGGLYVAKNVRLNPVILGGHQQNNLRSGTHNTTGIIGFSKAVCIMEESFSEKCEKLKALKNKLIENLKENDLFEINNGGDLYSPHIISMRIKNVRAEVILHALESYGICISAGSACSSNKPSPSHVLTAMGYDKKKIEETIRVSTGAFSTIADINAFCDTAVKEASALSRFTRV